MTERKKLPPTHPGELLQQDVDLWRAAEDGYDEHRKIKALPKTAA